MVDREAVNGNNLRLDPHPALVQLQLLRRKMDRTKEGAMLVAGQYVGGGRGKLPGRLVQGELPVRGVGR